MIRLKAFLFGLLLCLPAFAQAADVKFSELPSATTPTGAEIAPIVQSGANKKTTLTSIAALATKSTVGLSNVDNTSDANKPVSTAQQTALDLKLSKSLAGDTTIATNSFDFLLGDITTSSPLFAGGVSTMFTVGSNGGGDGISVSGASSAFPAVGPAFYCNRSRGTLAAPTALQSGDEVCDFFWGGWDGTAIQNPAYIGVVVTGAVSSGVMPADMVFYTGGSTGGFVEAGRILDNGTLSWAKAITSTSTVTGSNLSGTNTGDITLAAVGSSPSANGASLSGQALTLQPADATHPGLVTTGSQTFAGTKTFSSTISGAVSGNAGTATALAANGSNCSAGSFPLGVDASGAAESCTTLSSSNAGTATALAANPTDCGAGTKATAIDASGNLTCSAASLTADVSGTLPVANGGTGITSLGTGVATWWGTPSSANLATAITDETGSGAAVFATSPALVTPALGAATGTSLVLTGTSANIIAAGPSGTTNPTLLVDASVASAATGISITPAASGSGVTVAAIGGTNEALVINGKGTGQVTIGSTNATPFNVKSGSNNLFTAGNNVSAQSDMAFGWTSSTTNSNTTVDTLLTRRAAAGVNFGDADAAAPVAQTISVQGARGGTDTNTAAVTTTIQGSLGTGTGATGDIVFKVGTPQATGTTAHVAATVATLHDAGSAGTSKPQILVPDGIIGNPTYSFANSTSTGIYSRAANAITFVGNGTERFEISSVNAKFPSTQLLQWLPGAISGSAADTAIKRSAAGVLEINDGTAGHIRGFLGGGTAVASATALPLPTGNVFHVTGTTNVTSITSTNFQTGVVITLIFDGALTFTDGSNLVLAGNFVTTADDTITLTFDGTNWYEIARSVN